MKSLITLESHNRQESVLASAKGIPAMNISSKQLDCNPMVLNVMNGTIDLTTGNLNPHRYDDFITRLVEIEYDPNAACPTFLQFLDRVFDGKQELIDYLQRFVGYCLTGKTS